jgi:hypothetical protein
MTDPIDDALATDPWCTASAGFRERVLREVRAESRLTAALPFPRCLAIACAALMAAALWVVLAAVDPARLAGMLRSGVSAEAWWTVALIGLAGAIAIACHAFVRPRDGVDGRAAAQ